MATPPIIAPSVSSPTITEILADKGLYGDGSPHWSQGRNDEPCQTAEHANYLRRKEVKFLGRHAPTSEFFNVLTAKLEACTTDAPCSSGACPSCMRAIQRFAVLNFQLVLEQAASQSGDNRFVCVSIIPTHPSARPRSIVGGPARACRRVLNGLRRAGITWAVGGLDFSFNGQVVHVPGLDPFIRERLSVHAWLIMSAAEVEQGRDILRTRFPSTNSAPRPVKVFPFNGDPRGLAYAVKGDFIRRMAILPVLDDHGRVLKRRNTRNKRPRVDQRLPLLRDLDDLGLLGRLILHGVDIGHGQNGPEMTLTRRLRRMPRPD